MGIIPITAGICNTICPRCRKLDGGQTTGDIVKAVQPNGQTVFTNKAPLLKKSKLITAINNELNWVDVDPGDEVPSHEVCDSCATELQSFAKIVADGGVFIRCAECGIEGVANPKSQLAIQIRATNLCPAPKPIGYTFQKCTEHKGVKA